MFAEVYRGKTVFVTGHTGFKGSWLCLWLERLGARVVGYALAPTGSPNLFDAARVPDKIESHFGDVRDAAHLAAVVAEAKPDFVFHLAAQPLVLESYSTPVETFDTNVMGSINLMEALRGARRPSSVVMITTDKVYRNLEWLHAYRENDALGGYDPYSASKAAMEIAVSSWRDSFFPPAKVAEHGIRMASARAGNVIGGGDWSANRIVPDLARSLSGNTRPALRNPQAMRPWQHVLDPLCGYLWLGARLSQPGGEAFAEGWNFGPQPTDVRNVGELTGALLDAWGRPGWDDVRDPNAPHEAGLLKLAIDKAISGLGWRPAWTFAETVQHTAGWYTLALDDIGRAEAACAADLDAYCADVARLELAYA